MKKFIFWSSQIVLTPLFIFADILVGCGEKFMEWCHEYEAWALDYKKYKLRHIGQGIYTDAVRNQNDQK